MEACLEVGGKLVMHGKDEAGKNGTSGCPSKIVPCSVSTNASGNIGNNSGCDGF